MPRPTWKGSISFGLVNIPVVLYPAEERNELSFHMYDSRNNARVRYERVNDTTGKPVPWDKIVKGYELDEEEVVLLDDKDFERAAIEATHTVEIEDFVDVADIPVAYFDKPYILVPGKNGDKGYVVLREALRKTGMVGIAKVVIRTRQYLAAVLPDGEALLLCVLRFASELRDPAQYDVPDQEMSAYKISSKEVDMATQLIKSMSAKWKPEKYHDEYSEKLITWIKKKAAAHGQVMVADTEKAPKPAGEIINIMDLLKRSVQESSRRVKTTTVGAMAREKTPKPKARGKSKPKTKSRKRAS